MKTEIKLWHFFTASCFLFALNTRAAVEGALSGAIVDGEGAAVAGARIELRSEGASGAPVYTVMSGSTGNFAVFPVTIGQYDLRIVAKGYRTYGVSVAVGSGSSTWVDARLTAETFAHELVVEVQAKRNLTAPNGASSKTEISREQILSLPGGAMTSLPKLIGSITPGVVQGPFGQMFFRGNHANIQYQIDGAQLPESASGTFGDAFSTRNIESMEVISGGMPAEYGERLGAVVNIVTRSGPEKPGGEAEVRYGSYDTIQPQANYGGSNASGRLRYYVAGSYLQSGRGLDVPNPSSYADQRHGGKDSVHNLAKTNDEFARLDWVADDDDKFTLILFNSERRFQIPNYPSSLRYSDPYFQAGFVDAFGNSGGANPTFNWTPPGTDDSQGEQDSYIQGVWKRTLSERSFLQVSPYYKRSKIGVANDPANDLMTLKAGGPAPITSSQARSFSMDHVVDNIGAKADWSQRSLDARHLFKVGAQAQQSRGTGGFSLATDLSGPQSFAIGETGYLEALYAQDAWHFTPNFVLNYGVRYTATQFNSDKLHTQESMAQPRAGLEWSATESTKLHLFYGKLFQPAPYENLREAFITTQGGGNSAQPFDLKAEKDDYYEAGVAQQYSGNNLVRVTAFYKSATDMLDDQALANTSIAQPYNFAQGYASGLELSYAGRLSSRWDTYLNYSYEDARGLGRSGGSFAFNAPPSMDYQFLDHCQLNTANAGLTFRAGAFSATAQALYGSGLRTGTNNALNLPSHLTFDASASYNFGRDGYDWTSGWRAALDIGNLFDDAYPITINNGYNGSHYAAGRQFFVRLAKSL